MRDLSAPDTWDSTRAKAGKWARLPYVVAGYLPLFDAACLMSGEGYGGIFDDCSRATQNEIRGIHEALKNSIAGGRLEGYCSQPQCVNGSYLDAYPLIAYRNWIERTGVGDGRYFEKAQGPSVDVAGDDEPEAAGGVFQYPGDYPVAIDRNSPRYVLSSKRKSMTVYEFACLYCGIDPEGYIPDRVRNNYIEPLINLMAEHMELVEDDIPF